MYDYETLVVLHPDLGDAGTKELIQKIRTILESAKSQIKKVDEWGVRELAYTIRKQRRGFYALVEYAADPQAVTELERQLRLSEQVLRFMTIRQRKKKTLPPRQPREDRGLEEPPEVLGG
jgi:small subunit ribosomal protein S6